MLGSGSFGLVIRAIDREAQPPVHVAIKLLPRGNFIKNFKTYVNREILHQSSLKHPFIISLREVSQASMTHQPPPLHLLLTSFCELAVPSLAARGLH